MNEIYSQFLEAFDNVGIHLLSNDLCAKLLAILYVYGGGNECFVVNKKCLAEVMYAQKHFNINGGEVPNDISLIKKYVVDLLDGKQFMQVREPKQWAIDFIKERYNEDLK